MLIFRKPLRFFQAVPAVCLGLACLLAVSASAQAQQARTLTLTFSDDGGTVTIDAAGSLDFSASGSLPDSTIGIEDAIYFDDTAIWAIGSDSSGLNSLMGQYQLSGLTTTVVEPFSGSPTAENLPNYSAEFFLRFSTFHNRMRVDPDNLTGTIYDPTGDQVTFTGTLQSTLGDNDFHIEHAFGNQKIVFKTAAPSHGARRAHGLERRAGRHRSHPDLGQPERFQHHQVPVPPGPRRNRARQHSLDRHHRQRRHDHEP